MAFILNEIKVPDRIYLPAGSSYNPNDDGVPIDDEISNYVAREFAIPRGSKTANYTIPGSFVAQGKEQASQAEEDTFNRLRGVQCPRDEVGPLWQVCFQGASYAGRSYRNDRAGKLMMREHDFVVFNIFQGRYYISLIEVKSTCDDASIGMITKNPLSIKNNKRSGLHQLRDHVEILEKAYGVPKDTLHCYLFWPFLTRWTKDPSGQKMPRWKEEEGKHVFTDTISNQDLFNEWFYKSVLKGKPIDKSHFDSLFKRFIIMSCGIFVNEIHDGMLALLSQEQMSLMYRKPSKIGSPTIVHGAAGTGKTLLVIHKIQQLYQCGLLNENNRALYICYWPGIRADVEHKLEKLKLSKYVDTTRFFISQDTILLGNIRKYRHIFMDECEAICLAFNEEIITITFDNIESHRLTEPDEMYQNNQMNAFMETTVGNGYGYIIENNEIVRKKTNNTEKVYGELWFLVDINQAAFFLPKYSPAILKKPDIVLSKVLRNTGSIYKVFSQFYKNPIPAVSQLAHFYLDKMDIGHDINGPPVYWANSDKEPQDDSGQSGTFNCVIKVIIDLCSTKGVKSNDLCVIPFIVTDNFVSEKINDAISSHYVADGYRPTATSNVEEFISDCDPKLFLVPWVLKVKGLEFKVVILAVEDGDFEFMDSEDRRKIYIMASRCTCLLILVTSESVKQSIDANNMIKEYSFGINF